MKPLYELLDTCRNIIRKNMRIVARVINRLSGGRISPNTITIIGLATHIPIAWLIATCHPIWAAGLLVIFGLFDTLDGELARLQKRASNAGMLLDASTDRFKEVIIYVGVAYNFVVIGRPYATVWAVAACGASLSVSYVKAKGETAVAGGSLTADETNRLFQDGLMRFEVRIAVLIIGLLTNQLVIAVAVIAILASVTAIDRLIKISRKINDKN